MILIGSRTGQSPLAVTYNRLCGLTRKLRIKTMGQHFINVTQILSGSEWNGRNIIAKSNLDCSTSRGEAEAKPSEMEQSKFYLAIIFLPFHEFKPLNICFI